MITNLFALYNAITSLMTAITPEMTANQSLRVSTVVGRVLTGIFDMVGIFVIIEDVVMKKGIAAP